MQIQRLEHLHELLQVRPPAVSLHLLPPPPLLPPPLSPHTRTHTHTLNMHISSHPALNLPSFPPDAHSPIPNVSCVQRQKAAEEKIIASMRSCLRGRPLPFS